MQKGQSAHLAVTGARFQVRVTPRAARNSISEEAGHFRIGVTAAPEDGKATREVTRLLARVLGVAPSRLTLLRGARGRDKVFVLD